MGGSKGIVWCGLLAVLVSTSVHAVSFQDDMMIEGFGLGYAVTALPKSLDAGNKNPALLTTLPRTKASFTYSNSPDTTTAVYAFSAAKPTAYGTFGLAIPVRSITGIPETIEDGNRGSQIGVFSDTQTSVKFSFATEIAPKLSLGITSAYNMHTLYSESATGYSIDVGGAYAADKWAVGASITDVISQLVWSTGRKEQNKASKHAGLSVDVFDNTSVSVDGDYVDGHALCNLGVDWRPTEHLDVMMGVKDVAKEKDVRIGINLHVIGAVVSYAMSATGPLGIMHRAGITVEL